MSAPTVGTVLADRYELVRHIARGGMGDVYEAQDRVLRRGVAVKVYRAAAPADRSRFDAEVTTLAALNHPGLVQVYDAGEHGGDGYVVLELVDGPNLRTILTERGALPAADVAALGTPVAEALAYVHDQGVVHRDVTPANVLCGPDGRPRLADFGIARLVDTTRITAAATTIGTAAYMAPEQVEGGDVTPAADVYALGLVLREALTGRVAFEGPSHEAAIARLTRDPDVETDVPVDWQPLLRQMTARQPADRPTARVVAEELPLLGAGAPARTAAAAADAPTAAMASVAPVALAGAAAGAAVDGHAATEALPVSGGTAVMPAAMAPAAAHATAQASAGAETVAPAASSENGDGVGAVTTARSRRALWVALAVIGLVLLVGLTSRGGGIEVPPESTTTVPVVATTPPTAGPTTTVPPTTTEPPTTEAPKQKGRGEGKKDDWDDD